MKVQIATLVLEQTGIWFFMIRPRDDLIQEALTNGKAIADGMRNALTRHLRDKLGVVPNLYFVVEDLAEDGVVPVSIHAHGALALPLLPLPQTNAGEVKARWKRIATAHGEKRAREKYTKWFLRELLKGAAGFRRRDAKAVGLKAERNVYISDPKLSLFHDSSVTYNMKGIPKPSHTLGERRLVMTQSLTQEAKRLWDLIREGEPAVSRWDIQESA